MPWLFGHSLCDTYLSLHIVWRNTVYLGLVDCEYCPYDYHDFVGRVLVFQKGIERYSLTVFVNFLVFLDSKYSVAVKNKTCHCWKWKNGCCTNWILFGNQISTGEIIGDYLYDSNKYWKQWIICKVMPMYVFEGAKRSQFSIDTKFYSLIMN